MASTKSNIDFILDAIFLRCESLEAAKRFFNALYPAARDGRAVRGRIFTVSDIQTAEDKVVEHFKHRAMLQSRPAPTPPPAALTPSTAAVPSRPASTPQPVTSTPSTAAVPSRPAAQTGSAVPRLQVLGTDNVVRNTLHPRPAGGMTSQLNGAKTRFQEAEAQNRVENGLQQPRPVRAAISAHSSSPIQLRSMSHPRRAAAVVALRNTSALASPAQRIASQSHQPAVLPPARPHSSTPTQPSAPHAGSVAFMDLTSPEPQSTRPQQQSVTRQLQPVAQQLATPPQQAAPKQSTLLPQQVTPQRQPTMIQPQSAPQHQAATLRMQPALQQHSTAPPRQQIMPQHESGTLRLQPAPQQQQSTTLLQQHAMLQQQAVTSRLQPAPQQQSTALRQQAMPRQDAPPPSGFTHQKQAALLSTRPGAQQNSRAGQLSVRQRLRAALGESPVEVSDSCSTSSSSSSSSCAVKLNRRQLISNLRRNAVGLHGAKGRKGGRRPRADNDSKETKKQWHKVAMPAVAAHPVVKDEELRVEQHKQALAREARIRSLRITLPAVGIFRSDEPMWPPGMTPRMIDFAARRLLVVAFEKFGEKALEVSRDVEEARANIAKKNTTPQDKLELEAFVRDLQVEQEKLLTLWRAEVADLGHEEPPRVIPPVRSATVKCLVLGFEAFMAVSETETRKYYGPPRISLEDSQLDAAELEECVGKDNFKQFLINHYKEYDPDILQNIWYALVKKPTVERRPRRCADESSHGSDVSAPRRIKSARTFKDTESVREPRDPEISRKQTMKKVKKCMKKKGKRPAKKLKRTPKTEKKPKSLKPIEEAKARGRPRLEKQGKTAIKKLKAVRENAAAPTATKLLGKKHSSMKRRLMKRSMRG